MLLFNNFCSQELLELGIIPKEDCVLQMVCTLIFCISVQHMRKLIFVGIDDLGAQYCSKALTHVWLFLKCSNKRNIYISMLFSLLLLFLLIVSPKNRKKQKKKTITTAAANLYSKKPRSVTAFNLFTFLRADFVQSESSWKLSSTFDWLLST